MLVRAAGAIEGWGSPQVALGHRRMLELARDSSDDEALSVALQGMVWVHFDAARYHEAGELAAQMLKLSEHRNSAAALADAQFCQGLILSFTGHYDDALTALNRSIALCPDGAGRITVGIDDPLVLSLTFAAASAWPAGYPDRALKLSDSAIKRSSELNQPLAIAHALVYATAIRSWRGEVLEAEHLCEQGAALAEEGGFVSYMALTRFNQGLLASAQGKHE